MTNNDILRRLRHALDIPDDKVAEIVSHTGMATSRAAVSAWLKRETDAGYSALNDEDLCRFLDGLIIERRGRRSSEANPTPQQRLSNNEILKKLRIALEMREEDLTAVFQRVDFVVTKAELGSFFRVGGHRNYRPCPEQVLRKFLQGLGKRPGQV